MVRRSEYKTLREQVKELLRASGLSQSELARRAEFPQPKISRYLAGKGDLNGDTIDRLLKILTNSPPK